MQAKGTAQRAFGSLPNYPRRIRLLKCLRLLPSKAVTMLAQKQKISGNLHSRRVPPVMHGNLCRYSPIKLLKLDLT